MTVMQRRGSPLIATSSSMSPTLQSGDGSTVPLDRSKIMDEEWNMNENDVELTKSLLASGPTSSTSSTSAVGETFQVSVGKYKEEMKNRRISSGTSRMARHVVDRLQGIYLSKKFSSYIPVSTEDGGNAGGIMHPSGRIPLVKGLDRVLSGAQPAAESVAICGIKPYRYFWYMLSGSKCNINAI